MSPAVRARADDPTMQRLPQIINRPLFARLQREWQAITQRPAVLHRASGWGLGVPFHSLDDIVMATGFCVRTGRDQPDVADAAAPAPADHHAANAVLARLLVSARTDDVAARVVLQRLLPGLVGRARRWGAHRAGGSFDAFDELLSAAWMVIREFPVERRPHHLAANLLRDSEARAFGRSVRRLLVHELTEPNRLDLPVELAPTEPADELAEVVACAGALSEHDLRLLELLVQGLSQAEMAALLSVSERTVRNHRDAMVHRLRSAAMAA